MSTALPPETDRHRRMRDEEENFRAWCVWQERVTFTYANGEAKRGVRIIDYVESWRDLKVVGLLPP
jgi:hypothetical protein